MKLFTTFFFASVLLTATSCTNEVTDSLQDNAHDNAIAFGTPQTKAAIESSFPDGSAFAVWGWYTNTDDTTGNPFDQETVTNNGGTWNYSGGTRYWVLEATYNFYAVYPNTVNAKCTSDGAITITDFDASTAGADAVDLMTAEATDITHATAESIEPVDLRFSHLLAKVNIVATVDGGNATITDIAFTDMDTQGTYQSQNTDNPWSNTSSGEDFTQESPTVLGATETDLLGDMLLIPQTVDNSIQLTVSYILDGTTVSDKKVSLPTNVTRWEAGKSYKYTLTFEGNNIVFSVNVSQWNTSMGGIITVE